MTEEMLGKFREAISHNFGCDSSFVGSMDFSEAFREERVWTGEIHQFELKNHPTASHCYAWEFVNEDGKEERITVLKTAKTNTAQLAFHAFVFSKFVKK